MRYEVIVVGGGPAGSSVAGQLARRGLRVLLLDAARFPRPKPCGECINPGAVAALRRLGLEAGIESLAPARLTGWRLGAGRVCCNADFPAGHTAIAIDRVRFDQALLGWAASQGAVVEQGARVTDLLFDGGRVAGAVVAAGGKRRHHRLPADFIVGADGLRSVVVRRLGLLGTPKAPPKVAFTAHWRGVNGLGERGELHFRGAAVCGIAPVGAEEANVTLVLPAGLARRRDQAEVLARWTGLRERFTGARQVGRSLATGPFDQPVRALHAPGALLVGDAAGYFDPLTGQGIYRALRGAELAAPALLRALSGDAGALGEYEDRLRREFRPGLRLQRWIDGVVRRPSLLAAGLGLMRLCPPAGRFLIGYVGDCYHREGADPFAYRE